MKMCDIKKIEDRDAIEKYHKFPKYSDTQKIFLIPLKFELCGSTIEK